eukprot:TRINITY_DN8787_c0_g3_i4.p1 TRINITY_DN8787_c0_g3~~TRINITY_DN8787_c0_g3_i4.p1  ORF type:complete len:255 (-),score=-37.65 TRINITY_DN8787_c0_g3_i4:301-1035(-)
MRLPIHLSTYQMILKTNSILSMCYIPPVLFQQVYFLQQKMIPFDSIHYITRVMYLLKTSHLMRILRLPSMCQILQEWYRKTNYNSNQTIQYLSKYQIHLELVHLTAFDLEKLFVSRLVHSTNAELFLQDFVQIIICLLYTGYRTETTTFFAKTSLNLWQKAKWIIFICGASYHSPRHNIFANLLCRTQLTRQLTIYILQIVTETPLCNLWTFERRVAWFKIKASLFRPCARCSTVIIIWVTTTT